VSLDDNGTDSKEEHSITASETSVRSTGHSMTTRGKRLTRQLSDTSTLHNRSTSSIVRQASRQFTSDTPIPAQVGHDKQNRIAADSESPVFGC
jgi:hypothetical protein